MKNGSEWKQRFSVHNYIYSYAVIYTVVQTKNNFNANCNVDSLINLSFYFCEFLISPIILNYIKY